MLKERLGKEVLYFDGGMGTLLQEKGLQAGELPEIWNLTHMEEVIEIHRDYFEAGSDIVLTNTFGANALKFQDSEYELEDIVTAAVIHVKEAAYLGVHDDREVYTALDIGPTGKLLKPMGDLDFEDAYQAFAQVMRWGEAAGADLIHIETMSDTYEMKAAVLAAKEQTSLPVFATMIFDEKGRLLTGADVRSAMAMLEGLGVDALGINCGLGPEQMLPIFQEIVSHTSLPVIVKPNAGLPKQKDGAVYYDVTPKEFVRVMEKIVDGGAAVIGGCCGTTPGHIRNMTESFGRRAVKKVDHKEETVVSSYGAAVVLDDCPVVIGERINPKNLDRLGINTAELAFSSRLPGYPAMPLTAAMKEEVSSYPNVIEVKRNIDRYPPDYNDSYLTIFPFHETFEWTRDNYGPIWIPSKGATVSLDTLNLPLYERIITSYEGNSLRVADDGRIFINGAETDSYTFRQDYYFMMGDNRHNSLDSRYWGFVPEDHIVGKPALIWFSSDKNKSFPKNIRWRRFFKVAQVFQVCIEILVFQVFLYDICSPKV